MAQLAGLRCEYILKLIVSDAYYPSQVDSLSSKFKIIHVAGTKGKGTTCYYCNHILHEYQKIYKKPERIGCYTSPHQVEVRDRIQINSESISKNLFAKHFLMLWNKIHALANRPELDLPVIPGYPGFLMLLAIYIFLLEETDVIIIETGIGGENDSTNVFQNPIATGITTIGLDHVEILGNSIEAIAWHKSGIFKPGCLAFTVEQDEAVLKVLRERAEEKGVAGPLEVVTERIVLDYRLTVTPDTHSQRLNAALAISLAGAYLKSIDPDFCMTTELAQSVEHLQLPGRCQTIADKNNTWLLSVAHNEISLRETIAWFKETIRHPDHQSKRDSISLLKVVYESLNTADVVTLHDVIFCTDQVDEAGKEKPDLIDLRTDRSTALKRQKAHAETWKALDGSSNVILKHTTREAVEFIRGNYKGARILVTGSHYLVGGTLDLLAKH
ncbi:MAG: hypothetical protein M1816_004374 [Peltula sp. TS41687]|nr:MAG: hypothetical protein M1816_004374 [Peltula sp. TS41687]